MADQNAGSGNYVVKAGDCMSSIGREHGFLWQTLWNLPENAALKQARNDPYVLLPGDQVYIPDIRKNEVPCATDKRHSFVLKNVLEKLKLIITDDEDKPLPNQPYILEIDDVQRFEGNTDGAGKIEHPIAPTARRGHLVVGTGDDTREYHLGLGHLDPIDTVSGLQARLFNLGFYNGPLTKELDSRTRTAVLMFQEVKKLPTTGKNDDATQAKVKELYGC